MATNQDPPQYSKKDVDRFFKLARKLDNLEKLSKHEQAEVIASLGSDIEKITNTKIKRRAEQLMQLYTKPISRETRKKLGFSETQAEGLREIRTREERILDNLETQRQQEEKTQRQATQQIEKKLEKIKKERTRTAKRAQEVINSLHSDQTKKTQLEQTKRLVNFLNTTIPDELSSKEKRKLEENRKRAIENLKRISPEVAEDIELREKQRRYTTAHRLLTQDIPQTKKKLQEQLESTPPSQLTDQEVLNLFDGDEDFKKATKSLSHKEKIKQARKRAIDRYNTNIQATQTNLEEKSREYKNLIAILSNTDISPEESATLFDAGVNAHKLSFRAKKRQEILKPRESSETPKPMPMSKKTVERMLEKHDPLEMLGIDQDSEVSIDEIKNKYDAQVSRLLHTPSPQARRALQRLEHAFTPILESHSLTSQTSKASKLEGDNLKYLLKLKQRDLEQEAAEYNKRKIRDTGIPVSKHPNEWRNIKQALPKEFTSKLSRKHMYEQDMRRRRQALEAMGTGALLVAASPAIITGSLLERTSAGRAVKRKVKHSITVAKETVSAKYDAVGRSILKRLDIEIEEPDRRPTRINSAGVADPMYKQRKRKRSTILRKYIEKRKRQGKKGTHGFNPLTLGKVLWEVYIQPKIDFIKDVAHSVKEAAATYSGYRKLMRTKDAIGGKIATVKTKFWGGKLGKGLVRINQGINGVKALARASVSGLKAGGATLITASILTGGLTTPAILVAGGAGLVGTGAKLISDTLNSRVLHPIGRVAEFQKRFGIAKYLNEDGQLIQKFVPRSKLLMFSNSINSTFYGMAIGTALSTIIPGLGPVAGMLIGGGAGFAAKFGSQYAMNKVIERLGALSGETTLGKFITITSGTPIFSVASIATSIPWIDSQIQGIRKYGLKFIQDQWFSFSFKDLSILKSTLNWVNLLNTISSSWSIGSWAAGAGLSATALGGMALGGVTGFVVGAAIASSLGMTVATGAVIGAALGTVVGGVIGSTFGPIGTFIGSFVGSTAGTLLGSVYDTIKSKLGELDALGSTLSAILGALSLFKGIWDFFKTLSEKFNPGGVLSFALTLIFGLPLLMKMTNSVTENTGSQNNQNTSQQAQISSNEAIALIGNLDNKEIAFQNNLTNNIAGKYSNRTIIDCAETENKKIINPKTSLVTKITYKNGLYFVQTEDYIFNNILQINKTLETYATATKGEIIGTCNN